MDARVDQLVSEVQEGRLSRRGFVERAGALGVGASAALAMLGATPAQAAAAAVAPKKWQRGKGWGWVWGKDDEVGNLNELSPALARKALELAKGRVYDLGLEYDRRSFKFAGHSEGEITTYRTPSGLRLQNDRPEIANRAQNTLGEAYASCLNVISDNVATQIDGLAHIYVGDPAEAYNGFRERDILGDYGLLKLGVETIPPILAPATMVDVAGLVGKDVLPGDTVITTELIQRALARQEVDIDPLDVVLIRTGTAGVWIKGDGVGANHEEIAAVDTAGINVSAARWLVEQKGALMVGSDTSGVEKTGPVPEQLPEGSSFNPVHIYLLVRQGVHIIEFANLEDLARDKVYKFAFALAPNKVRGNVAGTVMRPIGMA